MAEYIIEMRNIVKRFGKLVANDHINLFVKENEVLALLGENGAGKSTLMSILFGAYTAESGTITIRGKEEHIENPNDATALKIGMVHQHFKLVTNYTVAENIILGAEVKNKAGLLDLKAAEKKVAELSSRYSLKVDPHAVVQDITVGMQQRVEILKVLYRDADIIIFDEPTAVLTPQEIDELMHIIRRLKEEGKTIILITHKLKEIKAVADRCTVLRHGAVVDTVSVANTTEQRLAEMMVGRPVNFEIEKQPLKRGDEVLRIENLAVCNYKKHPVVHDLNLTVYAGEILGIAGVDGNGQSELLAAISGMTDCSGGKIFFCGKDITDSGIRERIEMGMTYIPEDRQKHGIVGDFTVAENMVLKNYYKPPYTSYNILLNRQAMHQKANGLISSFDIRCGNGSATLLKSLSGGNQQKVIVAREIDLGGKLLVVAQPTRGLDVGAIEYIRKRILAERSAGRAILLVSFELDEIMNLCDRIATISKGTIVGTYNAEDVSMSDIGIMMAGSHINQDKKPV